MQAEYNWGNAMALDQLKKNPNVELREVPDAVFDGLRAYAVEAIEELAARDEFSARVQRSMFAFMEKSSENLKFGDLGYLNKRIHQGP